MSWRETNVGDAGYSVQNAPSLASKGGQERGTRKEDMHKSHFQSKARNLLLIIVIEMSAGKMVAGNEWKYLCHLI